MTTAQSPHPSEPPRGPTGEPAMTTTARRLALDEMRFIDIRHLAYQHYKKKDQTPLMTYQQTLADREGVKRIVLAYEVESGRLILDGTENLQPVEPQPQQAVQGEQQMNAPFVPNGAPQAPAQQQMFAPPAPPVPQQMQQQQFAPAAPPPPFAPQQGQMVPQPPQQMQAPQQMAPQQMAPPMQQASVPPQQEAPVAAPSGRKRKGAGTAVAPPPAVPGPVPQAPTQQFAPVAQQMQAPQGPPPAMFAAPGAPVQFAPQAPQAPQQQMAPPALVAQQSAPAVDFSQILKAQEASTNALLKKIEDLEKKVADLRGNQLTGLAVLHHMYLTNPQLAPSIADKKTLPEFLAHLQQFVGPI